MQLWNNTGTSRNSCIGIDILTQLLYYTLYTIVCLLFGSYHLMLMHSAATNLQENSVLDPTVTCWFSIDVSNAGLRISLCVKSLSQQGFDEFISFFQWKFNAVICKNCRLINHNHNSFQIEHIINNITRSSNTLWTWFSNIKRH